MNKTHLLKEPTDGMEKGGGNQNNVEDPQGKLISTILQVKFCIAMDIEELEMKEQELENKL